MCHHKRGGEEFKAENASAGGGLHFMGRKCRFAAFLKLRSNAFKDRDQKGACPTTPDKKR